MIYSKKRYSWFVGMCHYYDGLGWYHCGGGLYGILIKYKLTKYKIIKAFVDYMMK